MKKNHFESNDGLLYLEPSEMQEINGGTSVWEWLGYVGGQTLRCFEHFSKTAADYQASLPANLKK